MICLLLCGSSILVACGGCNAEIGDDPAYEHVEIVAVWTQGVAPLAVHLSAEYPEDLDSGRWFHELEYSWDFGDPGSGFREIDSTSRNEAKGPIGFHVFENPGDYTVMVSVKNRDGVVSTDAVHIEVADPDFVYAGLNTICVSTSGDFSGAPTGCRRVTTTDLDTVTGYAEAGHRVLFRRGESWSTDGLSDWPTHGGPVTIGAFGTGERPIITVVDNPAATGETFLAMNDKTDWRIMDLDLRDATRSFGSFGGTVNMQRWLFLRLRIRGFNVGLGWSHWNVKNLVTIEQMAVVDCDMADSRDNVLYVGGERLAVVGNLIQNARESHVARAWQAYKSVIAHNIISGSSLDTENGRHALKLHGPGNSSFQGYNEYGTPVPDTGLLGNITGFTVVSDNVFGASGPWPVVIGPQDEATDARIEHVIFERNRVISDFGIQNSSPVQASLFVSGRRISVRNNIFDGTSAGNDYAGIRIWERGVELPPADVEIFNNTIFRPDNATGNTRVGILVGGASSEIRVTNNIVCFPFPGVDVSASVVEAPRGTTEAESNLCALPATFVDPMAPDPLARDYTLHPGSAGIDQGTTVALFEDFKGSVRPQGRYDIGAHEQ